MLQSLRPAEGGTIPALILHHPLLCSPPSPLPSRFVMKLLVIGLITYIFHFVVFRALSHLILLTLGNDWGQLLLLSFYRQKTERQLTPHQTEAAKLVSDFYHSALPVRCP